MNFDRDAWISAKFNWSARCDQHIRSGPGRAKTPTDLNIPIFLSVWRTRSWFSLGLIVSHIVTLVRRLSLTSNRNRSEETSVNIYVRATRILKFQISKNQSIRSQRVQFLLSDNINVHHRSLELFQTTELNISRMSKMNEKTNRPESSNKTHKILETIPHRF